MDEQVLQIQTYTCADCDHFMDDIRESDITGVPNGMRYWCSNEELDKKWFKVTPNTPACPYHTALYEVWRELNEGLGFDSFKITMTDPATSGMKNQLETAFQYLLRDMMSAVKGVFEDPTRNMGYSSGKSVMDIIQEKWDTAASGYMFKDTLAEAITDNLEIGVETGLGQLVSNLQQRYRVLAAVLTTYMMNHAVLAMKETAKLEQRLKELETKLRRKGVLDED